MLSTPIAYIVLMATWLPSLAQATPRPDRSPRRIIAGVSVVDTPIVRAAQQFARDHSDDQLYNHVMRAWLWGALILKHNETLRASVDEEVQAIALVLHDLGAGRPNNTFASPDRRFEVDGAIAARSFIRAHRDGRHWDERRVQLVWDAIAFHSEPRYALFKEPDVVAAYHGNNQDFSEPRLGVTEAEYAAVLAEFPKSAQRDTVIEGISWLCRNKPETTYDTFMQPFGEQFVPGYSAVGHRVIDGVLAGYVENET
ncbi:hypothetical protein C8A01DRAFT_44673 [Parachaetomium inaequale]|uniref:HD domain-containing protein n=1 Tax=Parachaetomium inaequale TaxID=2588326 RepID=A0AAN6SU22_9PEZI|nr:hypothetical protein C8A01DRAFT_44673 [Parachaetomium inaequale]